MREWMTWNLRRRAQVLPGFLRKPLKRLGVALHPQLRRQHRRQEQELGEFARHHSALLRDREGIPAPTRTLLVATGGSGSVKLEMVLVKALRLAGFHPVVLGWRDDVTRRYYRLWGMNDYLGWEDLFPPRSHNRAMPRFDSFEQVLAYSHAGARVGKYAASWVMRQLRVGSLDPQDKEIWKVLVDHLQRGMNCAHAAREIVRRLQPEAALFLEHGYSPWGELFDVCVEAGVDTLQWSGCHKDNALMLKRYHKGNAHMHPASLSEASWRSALTMSWGSAETNALVRELRDNYSSGQWFGEVGTQFNKTIYERGALQERLGLDRDKPTAVVFAHMFWDATFFYGTDLFRDYAQWFAETLGAAARNRRLNWLVKIHPANVVKNRRDGFAGELSEKSVIRTHLGVLPDHIRLIEPESDVSTFSLFSLMDFCLTVRGTIGIEAASFGIPVLTAGTGRYDRLGFTIDSDSSDQYLALLGRLPDLARLTPDVQEKAQRYAYAVFVKRPWQMSTVRLEYAKDETASAQVSIKARSLRELAEAEDLGAFTRWAVDRAREDYWTGDGPSG